LENGRWINSGISNSSGYSFNFYKVSFTESGDFHHFSAPGLFWSNSVGYPKDMGRFNTSNDNKGNLILITITQPPYPNPYCTVRINYNSNNNPVLIETYDYTRLIETTHYEYNGSGQIILIEHRINGSYYQSLPNEWLLRRREIVQYDEKGRPTSVHGLLSNENTNNILRLDRFRLFYYSDDENTPDIEIDNNSPIGDDNQGSFNLVVNIPIDSISNGSITVTFPDGFILDEKNTNLTLDFAGLFELKITKQENNSWLLEFIPKILKNASLRTDEVKKMLEIAYNVNETVKQGTYEISVNSILFESKGGNFIPAPPIGVSSVVERWGVGNETIVPPTIWSHGNTLHIRTPQPATLKIYTLTGALFRQQTLPAGETAIPLPPGTYLVQIEKTVKKILIR
jgi:hypothetical protein